jgi:hypothetical protein
LASGAASLAADPQRTYRTVFPRACNNEWDSSPTLKKYAAFPRSFPARLIVAPGILLPKD